MCHSACLHFWDLKELCTEGFVLAVEGSIPRLAICMSSLDLYLYCYIYGHYVGFLAVLVLPAETRQI